MAESGPSGATTDDLFEAIEQQRAHEYVADQIRRQIGLGIIGPGEALPPERDLARMFGVGRATVQLAMGTLEAQRLITTRRGRSGGSFVLAALEPSAVDMRVIDVANSSDVISSAIDYRIAVEPVVAGLAASRRTKADIGTLSRAAQRMADADTDQEFMRRDTAFHLAIAKVTRNSFLIEGIENTRLQLNAVLSLLPDTRAEHVRSIRDHEQILSAIEERDAAAASSAMTAHVQDTSENLHTILRSITRRRQAPGA
jgi:GntR family transcriptional repressor for pyruvate dehydrogenase complex